MLLNRMSISLVILFLGLFPSLPCIAWGLEYLAGRKREEAFMGGQVEEELTARATIRTAGGKLTELVPSWN